MLESGVRAGAHLPVLWSNRDEALGVEDTLSRGQTCRLLELLRVSALRDVLQESQLPEVPGHGLRGPQAVPGLVALGRRLGHLHLQIALVLQVHGGTAGRETGGRSVRHTASRGRVVTRSRPVGSGEELDVEESRPGPAHIFIFLYS